MHRVPHVTPYIGYRRIYSYIIVPLSVTYRHVLRSSGTIVLIFWHICKRRRNRPIPRYHFINSYITMIHTKTPAHGGCFLSIHMYMDQTRIQTRLFVPARSRALPESRDRTLIQGHGPFLFRHLLLKSFLQDP